MGFAAQIFGILDGGSEPRPRNHRTAPQASPALAALATKICFASRTNRIPPWIILTTCSVWMKHRNPAMADLKAESLIQELDKSGYIDQLYTAYRVK